MININNPTKIKKIPASRFFFSSKKPTNKISPIIVRKNRVMKAMRKIRITFGIFLHLLASILPSRMSSIKNSKINSITTLPLIKLYHYYKRKERKVVRFLSFLINEMILFQFCKHLQKLFLL